jgi:GH25 family lysozyme M1 (1,4-beta-N-acetylmuramidase)
VGLNRLALAALVVGLASAGAAFGADGPPTHPELDYAGSGRARFHVPKTPAARPAGLPGLDVSSWQGNVDWASVAANGARFAFVKATEGTTYVNPYFGQQYVGAYVAGMVRGAYHFGLPDRSTGAAQAQWFAANGGAWSADGQTLPGALDIEYNPYGPTCYGLSQSAMVSWLTSFVTEYQTLTGRSPVIYSTTASGRPSRSGSRAGVSRPARCPRAGARTRSGSGRTSRSTSLETRTCSTARRTISRRSRTGAALLLRSRRLLHRRRHFLRRQSRAVSRA